MKLSAWPLSLIPSLLLLLSGCTYTGKDNSLTGNAAGPLIGATAGVAGTAALGAPRPIIVGAGIGGAALGYYMTTLRFDSGPIIRAGGEVYTQGDYVGINLPAYRLFEPNTDRLTPQAQPLLDTAISVLKRYPDMNVYITCSGSGMGSRQHEQELSEARARQVASYLWAHGINSFKKRSIETRRLAYAGYGDKFPIVNPVTKVGNIQQNSRVQITLYPSAMDLKLDRKSKIFNNVGGEDETGET